MLKNIIFIINYNSHEQISKLLNLSDLSIVNITHCVIYNNGGMPSDTQINDWNKSFLNSNISFEVLYRKNDGYGSAINECINLVKINYSKFDYVFFSNADITTTQKSNLYPYSNYDAVGFPMYQHNKYIVSKITIFTPLIPFRFRKFFYSKPEFGLAKIVHGCFFGLRVKSLFKLKIKFYEKYFLYWEETQFFYEINKLGFTVGISDMLKINHDGEKSVFLDNARYYMFRNGLYFYRYVYQSYFLFLFWLLINYIYAFIFCLKNFNSLPSWFIQAKFDYDKNKFGKRTL